MSRTKETPEFKEVFGNFNPVEMVGKVDKMNKAQGFHATVRQAKTDNDEIDEIISYFEEKMQFDPPKGRYGIGLDDMPDVELYIGDKAAARGFIVDKTRQMLRRLLFDVENKRR